MWWRILCVSLLLRATVAIDVGDDNFELGPNLSEWKANQANATLSAEAKAAREAKMAAVNKVVSMLEETRSQILQEGEDEAATYNKFACFCKDTTTEKLADVKTGSDEKDSLSATISDLESHRADLDEQMGTLSREIETAEDAMKTAEEDRAKEQALYAKNEADLAGAINALSMAIQTMKASDVGKASSLLQFQAVAKNVQTALLMADALGVGSASMRKTMAGFLQQEPKNAVPTEDYKFHSGDIIDTLEKLHKDFTAEKNDIDAAEVKSVSEHDMFMQTKSNYLKAKNLDLDSAKREKAKTTEQIASNTAQLSTVAAELLDDQEYVKELSVMCSDKAKTWDQRSQVRSDELSTLTEVIGIISGMVTDKTSAATVRFNQQGVSLRLAKAMAGDEYAMNAVEAAAEATEHSTPALLQLARKALARRNLPHPDLALGRSKAADILKAKGEELHSALLTSLASQLTGSADPLAKVKTLIQELIEKLLAEAGKEASQKGWCDKALADARQKRDYAADEIKELNAEMASLEAVRDKLMEELSTLDKEIKELKATKAKASQERSMEKNQNAATVTEANAGLEALNMAIDILDKFYKTAAKGSVSMSLVQGPADDAPDAGFKNFEAYTGAQGEAGGILGMLDVMKSDFERTISETEAAEAEAEQDHLEFLTETGKSIAGKSTAENEKTKQKDDAVEKLEEAEGNLELETKTLKTAITELLNLQPTCIDTGMTYEERVARREDEIAALKKALCILSAYAEYGPEGAGAEC